MLLYTLLTEVRMSERHLKTSSLWSTCQAAQSVYRYELIEQVALQKMNSCHKQQVKPFHPKQENNLDLSRMFHKIK